jgi:hypothetical protein
MVAVAAVSLAVGIGIGAGSSSGSSDDEGSLVTGLSYRMDASPPPPGRPPRLRNVLNSDGLRLKAACQLANGLPVLEVALSSSFAASFAVQTRYQDDETFTRITHDLSPGQIVDLLGPIGKGNGATGTLTYLRPDGRAATVEFVAMTRAGGTDCVLGGTVIQSS